MTINGASRISDSGRSGGLHAMTIDGARRISESGLLRMLT